MFKENPIPKLELKNIDKQELNNKYELQDITFQDTEDFVEEVNALYPESGNQHASRTQKAILRF